jgi:hypothetical protein
MVKKNGGKKEEEKNHGLKGPRCTGVCPQKGYCGKYIVKL